MIPFAKNSVITSLKLKGNPFEKEYNYRQIVFGIFNGLDHLDDVIEDHSQFKDFDFVWKEKGDSISNMKRNKSTGHSTSRRQTIANNDNKMKKITDQLREKFRALNIKEHSKASSKDRERDHSNNIVAPINTGRT